MVFICKTIIFRACRQGVLQEFDNDMLIYEESNNESINSVLCKLGFCKYKESFLMKLVLFNKREK